MNGALRVASAEETHRLQELQDTERGFSSRDIRQLMIRGTGGTVRDGPSVNDALKILGFKQFFAIRALDQTLPNKLDYKKFSESAGSSARSMDWVFSRCSHLFCSVVARIANVSAIAQCTGFCWTEQKPWSPVSGRILPTAGPRLRGAKA